MIFSDLSDLSVFIKYIDKICTKSTMRLYIESNEKRLIFMKKYAIIELLSWLILSFAGLTYLAGARDFLHGFLYSFIISASVKLYVTLILQCVVLVNSPKLWLPGTEDLKSEWTNRKFYMSSIPRSLFAFGLVSLIIGAVISVICR